MLQTHLALIAGKIEQALKQERINLSKVEVKTIGDKVRRVIFYEGETAIKEEFAKFSLSFNKSEGWKCRPLGKNTHQLPIGKTIYLGDFLRWIVESVLDEMFEDGEVV